MPSINNIFNSKIGRVTATAVVNVGGAINVQPQHVGKSIGRAIPVGDSVANVAGGSNFYVDNDNFSGTRVT